MADLETWTNYVTIINAERLNAIKNAIITNEGNVSANKVGIDINTSEANRLEDEKLDRDGSQWMQGNLNLSNNFITYLPDPTLGYHAANKSYVDSLTDNLSSLQDDYLLLSGNRTMTGDLNMGTSDMLVSEIRTNAETGAITMRGGQTAVNSHIFLFGREHAIYPGEIHFWAPNADKDFYLTSLTIEGITNTPKLEVNYGIKTDLIEEKTSDTGVTIDGCLIKDGKTQEVKLMPFHLRNLSSTEYLLGTGVTDTMYPFNGTVFLTNYVITYYSNASSRIDIELSDINGSWHSNSLAEPAAGGYQDNESFTERTVGIADKLQIKLHNISNINYMSYVLNYK